MFSAAAGGFIYGTPSGAATDPYWSSVALFLTTNNDGTVTISNTNRTFLDLSANNISFTLGAYSGTYSYASPFTGYYGSYYGLGTYPSGLKTGTNANLTFAGDFTVECWVRVPNGQTMSGYPSSIISVQNGGFFAFQSGAGTNKWAARGYAAPTYNILSAITSNDGVWRHLAFVRSGSLSGNLRFYVDGTQIGTATSTASFNYSGMNLGCGIGAGPGAIDNQYWGNITNIRLSNIARYTSAFTPSTTPFTTDANTQFLMTCQNAPFFDISNNKMPVNQYGSFILRNTTTKKWSTVASMNPDSAGLLSYLYCKDTNSATSLTLPGDFTWECWINSNVSQSTTSTIFSSTGISVYASTSSYVNKFSCTVGASSINSAITSNDATWHNIAIVRSGSTVTMYVDGTSVGTATVSTSLDVNSAYTGGPVTGTNVQFSGYLDELRITKGVARYTGNYSVATGPYPTS